MIKNLMVALSVLIIQVLSGPAPVLAQASSAILTQQKQQKSLSRYYDSGAGMSADDAVAYALTHNGELAAVRSEVEAARGLVQQASLRANPQLDIERKQQINVSLQQ